MKKLVLQIFALLVSTSAFAKMVLIPADKVLMYASAVLIAEKPRSCALFSDLEQLVRVSRHEKLQLEISDDSAQPLLVFTKSYDSILGFKTQISVETSADFKKIIGMMSSSITKYTVHINNSDLKNPEIVSVEKEKTEVAATCK